MEIVVVQEDKKKMRAGGEDREEECQQHNNNNKQPLEPKRGCGPWVTWAEAVEGGIIGTSLLQADRDD
jgi:hypothetical protein